MLKTQLSLEMKVLVTGDNLVFLIRVVNTLLNFDTVLVKIKMTAKSLVFTATNCFDGCVMHMFHPLFFSVFDNSEVESDTIVQVKHLVDCFKIIRLLENSVPSTKCFLEITQNKLTVTMEWRHGPVESSIFIHNFD